MILLFPDVQCRGCVNEFLVVGAFGDNLGVGASEGLVGIVKVGLCLKILGMRR